ncbi:MAG TPA: hypothetical protein VGM94_02350 [Galbitalea sp.]|jgi:hypothetical protein
MTNGLAFSQRTYRYLVSELARRGGGRRESGAFLLARRGRPAVNGFRQVDAFALYDDLDPDCLVGSIEMHPIGFSRLNALCRERGLEVVGDAHTHPSTHVCQSDIDSSNPMAAFPGHIALIVPRYAQGRPALPELGAHEFLGKGRWNSRFGGDVAEVLRMRSGIALWFLARGPKEEA